MKKKIYSRTREELLLNTIKRFNNLNRGTDPDKDPMDSFSLGCELTPFEKPLFYNMNKVPLNKVFHLYPKRLKALGLPFLQDVQALHSFNICWCPIGLTLQGRIQVNELIRYYNLNMDYIPTGIL